MPQLVREIQGSGRLGGFLKAVIEGDHLVFPNVLTCVAIIARSGGTLYGVHATTAHRGKMTLVRELLAEEGCKNATIYVVGPVSGYHLLALLSLGRVYFYECEGRIDVEAKLEGDTLTIGTRPNNGDGPFATIPLEQFAS